MSVKKVKYKLTADCQEWAIKLVNAWENDSISQYFELINVTAGDDKTIQIGGGLGILNDEFELPPINIILELSLFKLVEIVDIIPEKIEFDNRHSPMLGIIKRHQSQRWSVLLTQELKDAVENDFQVSDYFLTFNTVGTIIYGDAIDSNIASAAIGDVDQEISTTSLADELLAILGTEFVQSQNSLIKSIDALKQSQGEKTQSLLVGILAQLANSLKHGAHTAEIIAGIYLISKFLTL